MQPPIIRNARLVNILIGNKKIVITCIYIYYCHVSDMFVYPTFMSSGTAGVG